MSAEGYAAAGDCQGDCQWQDVAATSRTDRDIPAMPRRGDPVGIRRMATSVRMPGIRKQIPAGSIPDNPGLRPARGMLFRQEAEEP
jgi:hypothetical protein